MYDQRKETHPPRSTRNKQFIWTSFSERLLLGSWLIPQGSMKKFAISAANTPTQATEPRVLTKFFLPNSNFEVSQMPADGTFGNGPNTVSETTVSNTELSELFGAHWVPVSELSEFVSAYYLCAKVNSPSLSQNSPSLPQNSVRLSEFSSPKQYSRNSIPPVSQTYNKWESSPPKTCKNRISFDREDPQGWPRQGSCSGSTIPILLLFSGFWAFLWREKNR